MGRIFLADIVELNEHQGDLVTLQIAIAVAIKLSEDMLKVAFLALVELLLLLNLGGHLLMLLLEEMFLFGFGILLAIELFEVGARVFGAKRVLHRTGRS